MLVTMQVADVGWRRALRLPLPRPEAVPGLRDARGAVTARFNASLIPDAEPGRAVWFGFWDDEPAFDRFLNGGGPLVERFGDGWTLRMTPLRAHGAWPGSPTELPADDGYRGPVAVLTLGLLRLRRSIRWTIASNQVQKQFLEAPGVVWAMGASRPPLFAATMSIWESAEAASGFAHRPDEAHQRAVAANRASPFMRQELFARFRPVASSGGLDGAEPTIAPDWLDRRATA